MAEAGDVALSDCLRASGTDALDTRDHVGAVRRRALHLPILSDALASEQRGPCWSLLHPASPLCHLNMPLPIARCPQERFNPFTPEMHLYYRRTQDDWYTRFSPGLLDGAEGCSRFAVSFAGLGADEVAEVDRLVSQSRQGCVSRSRPAWTF